MTDTAIGRIGGLICGENNNPLARYVLMSEGEEIHCACYPAIWPFRNPLNATPYDLRKAIHFRSAAHCFEAKVFTIVSAGILDDEAIATIGNGDSMVEKMMKACPAACSMIVDPSGDIVAELPAGKECLLFAEIDLSGLVELKQHHDMAGYYNRGEIFRLSLVRERPRAFEEIMFERVASGPNDVETPLERVDGMIGVAAQ